MIKNPCVKCRWFNDDGHTLCEKGHWVDSTVYGKEWRFAYKEYTQIQYCRDLECKGDGFEPKRSIWQWLKDKMQGKD